MNAEFISCLVSDKDLVMLENDIRIILTLFESESELTMHDVAQKYSFHLRRGAYTSPTSLYSEMVAFIRYFDFGNQLLELMPYIDDYIDIYFK
jgi:hypothetical protein